MPESRRKAQTGANQFVGKVASAIHMGAEIHYEVRCVVGPLMVVSPSDGGIPFAPGDAVGISFGGGDCVVFAATGQ